MSLGDNNGNNGNGDDTSSEERFSLLEFDTPKRRICSFTGCNDDSAPGKEQCAKHAARLVTSVVRPMDQDQPKAKPAQIAAAARAQIAAEDAEHAANIAADAAATLAQQHADEEAAAEAQMEAEAEAMAAEIAAEHAAAMAPPVPARALLTPEGCEIWSAFYFRGTPVYAQTYTDGEPVLVTGLGRARMIYKAQPNTKVYECNPGQLVKRQADPVFRVAPGAVVAAVAPVAPVTQPRATPRPAIATGQPLVTPAAAPVAAPAALEQTDDGGTLEGALNAIATAHRPPPGLVNGYILPEDVNPVAGYYEQVIAAKGQPTRYRDDRLHAAAQISAERVREVKAELGMTVRAPQITHRATPRAVDASVPEPLRAGIEAARARVSPATAAMTKAARARAEKAAAELRARVTLDTAITIALQHASGEYPHGCIAAWHPTGAVRWSKVAAAAEAAGVAPPKERSLRAIASAAVKAIKDRGLVVAVVTRGSAWSVYRPATTAEVGASVGEARLVATLEGEDLRLEGPADLCATVRAAFVRAQQEAILGSTEVSAWLADLLRQYRAVSTVYGRWLAPGYPTDMWKALAGELRRAGLPVPARPAAVSSREDMREEIRDGLVHEVNLELDRIQAARERPNYGDTATISAVEDLEALADKAKMYTAMTGPGALDEQIAKINALRIELSATLDRAPLDMGRRR